MMVLNDHRRGTWHYRCSRDHRGRKNNCDLGEFVARKVDHAASEVIEAALSDADTIIRLVREANDRLAEAAPSGRELARRITALYNRRRRLVDIYETGEIDLAEFRKRVSAVDADRNSLAVMMDATEPPEIDESACIDLAYAFVRWGRLGRSTRRRLLESFGVRFWVEKDGRGRHATARIGGSKSDHSAMQSYTRS
ncbi:MAG: hypothetical protein IPK00_10405 [Deltaproteobacteria bacterium]|nr:hypothetical protein [Deltaproteobacteria bacterium]